MFQFTGFAFVSYVFRYKYLLMISASPKTRPLADRTPNPQIAPQTCSSPQNRHDASQRLCAPTGLFGITEIEGGFPHSEIRGSKVVRTSPRLIAAYHVLHRLSAPRHPPNTLKALDRSHYQRPPLGRGARLAPRMASIERPFASNISEGAAVKPRPQTGSSSSQDTHAPINDRICFLFTMTDSAHHGQSPNAIHFQGRSA